MLQYIITNIRTLVNLGSETQQHIK